MAMRAQYIAFYLFIAFNAIIKCCGIYTSIILPLRTLLSFRFK